MNRAYDAIIVGARCAGSPTAMLLARKGYRVLVVDRATFPSDTVSTHVVHPLGVAALARWGLLDRLTATGCPPIHTYAFDFGPFTISGSPGTADAPVAYCARRTVLDKLLVDAAAEAGAEIREGFTVEEVLIEDGRVVGIKGRSKGGEAGDRAGQARGRSGWPPLPRGGGRPARTVQRKAAAARRLLHLLERPADGRAVRNLHPRTPRIRGGADARRTDAHRRRLAVRGIRGQQEGRRGQFPEDVRPRARVRGTRARRETRGAVCRRGRAEFLPQAVRSWLGARRRCGLQQGPDHGAGHQRRLPRRRALRHRARTRRSRGARSFDDAMGEYQRTRDEHVLPMYEFTCQLATLEPPPPEMQQLFGAIHGNQKAMDGFVQMNAGTISPAAVLLAGQHRRDHAGGATGELSPIVGLERAR